MIKKILSVFVVGLFVTFSAMALPKDWKEVKTNVTVGSTTVQMITKVSTSSSPEILKEALTMYGPLAMPFLDGGQLIVGNDGAKMFIMQWILDQLKTNKVVIIAPLKGDKEYSFYYTIPGTDCLMAFIVPITK
jgi:hypothetical protein